MTSRPKAEQRPVTAPGEPQSRRRWLLFVHQLPSHPSNLRVRTWRRLQQLGAIPIKQAVYALPDTPGTREDFEWLKAEVEEAGGDASVFAADHVDAWSDDALIEEFRRSRQEAYEALARDVEKAINRDSKTRGPRGTRAPGIRRALEIFRERFTALEGVDFFGSAGRDRVVTLLKQLDEKVSAARGSLPGGDAARSGDVTSYQRRLWVTRPRPGVDRMSSAWLIQRFIDPQARFGFAANREAVPDNAVPFDMFGVEFSHRGDNCTFETFCADFGIRQPAVARIAEIVHDLDLKDARFGAPEAATVGAMIDGLQLAFPEDNALLEQGITLFDSLYRSFERSGRSTGPRPLARPVGQPAAGSKSRRHVRKA